MKDYYKILEIDIKADKTIIKKSYHRLALRFHPDKYKPNNSNNMSLTDYENKFKDIVEAYEVLSNENKRRKYNREFKNNGSFKFFISNDILNFYKYFFSNENLNKFKNLDASFFDNSIKININFENILHNFQKVIKNNNYKDIFHEYIEFVKFYNFKVSTTNTKTNTTPKYSNTKNDKNEKKNQDINKTYNKNLILIKKKLKDQIVKKNNIDFINKQIKKKTYQNININCKTKLENIYNGDIKIINLSVAQKCKYCNGTGVILKKENKNSVNKKKKNTSRKKKQ